jgi:LysW-gamma-L-lysine carboxypeptidase
MPEDESALLRAMLEIYSPTGQESELAGYLLDFMNSKMGYDRTWKDSVGNVFGEIGKGAPTVMLAGHLDTVPGFIPVREVGGKLYGRGASDAKGPLAAMLSAGRRVGDKLKNGRIRVACLIDEEGLSRGVKQLVTDKVGSDYAIFGEPGGAFGLTIAYKGRIAFALKVKSIPAHASAPWLGVNAVDHSYRIWEMVQSSPLIRGEGFESVTGCLTLIKGGSAENVVPSECEMTWDIRFPSPMRVDQVAQTIRGYVASYKQSGVEAKLDVADSTEPYEADKSSLLVRAFIRASLALKSTPIRMIRKTGTGDMNLYGSVTGTPCVTYGPGDPKLAHTAKEHIDMQDYLSSIGLLTQAVSNLLSLHPGS